MSEETREKAIEELAAYLSGPNVAFSSMSIGLSGELGKSAERFFELRKQFGVKGYATTTEAREKITTLLAKADTPAERPAKDWMEAAAEECIKAMWTGKYGQSHIAHIALFADIIAKHAPLPPKSASKPKVFPADGGLEKCPTCHQAIKPEMGPGDYSCAACGFGMIEPCEHWKGTLAESATSLPPKSEELCAQCGYVEAYSFHRRIATRFGPGEFYHPFRVKSDAATLEKK